MGESEQDREELRRVALFQRGVAMDTKQRVMDEMSHASRWIMASVLAINSGGLIAALGRVEVSDLWSVAAVVSFYLGVWLALTMGWKQISINQRLLAPHSEMIVFWDTASVDGHIDPEKLNEFKTMLLDMASREVLSSVLGRWAFVSFSAGLVCLAFSAAQQSVDDEQHESQSITDS